MDGASFTNSATGNARVEAQIGVVHGDANFYSLAEGASPEEKYRIGLNYLSGNMPRQAEELIRDAVMSGNSTTETAYYWALAILSGKSLDHLTEQDFDRLSAAFNQSAELDADRWSDALGVVARLVQALVLQEEQGTVDLDALDAVFAAYEGLPEERRDEIRRHLEMILAGGIQDQLEALDAAEVRRHRMGAYRADRAWKFFEHTPTAPIRRTPKPVATDVGAWFKLIGGAILLVAGTGLLAVELFSVSYLLTVLVVSVAGGGGYFAFGSSRQALRLTGERQVLEDRFAVTPAPSTDTPKREAEREFSRLISLNVDYYFARRRPKPQQPEEVDDDETAAERDRRRDAAAHKWFNDTAEARSALSSRLIVQYGTTKPRPPAGSLNWLIRLHARIHQEMVESDTLYEFRTTRRLSSLAKAALAGAWSAVVLAYLAGIAAVMTDRAPVAIAVIALVIGGGWVAVNGGLVVGIEACRKQAETTEFDRLLAAEEAEHRRWSDVLADAPTDSEMARWLDYDKAHIKSTYMKHFRLANRDVVAHLVLTEAALFTRRARVLYGPPRYSIYVVRLFLLTGAGVRLISVEVDFRTGALYKENRAAFRYEAVTSARMREVGVRLDNSQRELIDLPDVRRSVEASDNKLTLAQAFRLTLNNTEFLDVLVENFDMGLIDRIKEDPKQLLELAKDTSGVSSAVRVLEAVAAEGPRWIEEERARRHRRIEWYRRNRAHGARPAIGPGPDERRQSVAAPDPAP